VRRGFQVTVAFGILLLLGIFINECFASHEEILEKAVGESQNFRLIQKQLNKFEQQFQSFEGAATHGNDFSTKTKGSLLQKPLSFSDFSLSLVEDVKTPPEAIDRIIKKMFPAPKQMPASSMALKFNLDALDPPLKEVIQQLLDQIELISATDFETTLSQARVFADAIDKIFISQLQSIPKSTIKNVTLQSVTDPKIVIAIGDQGKNFYQADANNNFILIIDFGGDDTYDGAVAAGKFPLRTGIVIDLAGNDQYLDEKGDISQGAAVNGFGMLVDVQGDDIYVGSKRAQGYGGLNGVGILWDKSGQDRYVSYQYSQGAAGYFFPLEDTRDAYVARTKQEGFGLLLDNEGNDVYYTANNPTESSAQSPGFSDALSQGFGIGDRGVGLLIDLNGNDVYSSTIIAQGAGWNQGIGILYDEKGSDLYLGVHYVMGASAHRGFGAFFDLAGEDRYHVIDGQGAGASVDTGIASFVDGGTENDVYTGLYKDSGGAGMNNSLATFIDEGGNDFYYGSSMGRSDLSEYPYRGLNLGIFVDMAGKDFYSDNGKHSRQDNNEKCIKTESGSDEAKRHPAEVNGFFCDW